MDTSKVKEYIMNTERTAARLGARMIHALQDEELEDGDIIGVVKMYREVCSIIDGGDDLLKAIDAEEQELRAKKAFKNAKTLSGEEPEPEPEAKPKKKHTGGRTSTETIKEALRLYHCEGRTVDEIQDILHVGASIEKHITNYTQTIISARDDGAEISEICDSLGVSPEIVAAALFE